MVREVFATTLHIEPSCWRAAGGFSCQIQRYCLDDGISNQELLMISTVESAPQCSSIARERNSGRITTTAAREGARRACFPNPFNTGRGEIDCARIAPALDHACADLASNHVAPRQIDPECEIAKTNPGMQRRLMVIAAIPG